MAPPPDAEDDKSPTVQLKRKSPVASAPEPVPPATSAETSILLSEDDGDSENLAGLVVDGRYRLIKPLASGGMGSVWLAEQLKLNRKVAIKLMTHSDEELVERFRREAVAMSDVSHPAIVEIIDFSVLGDGGSGRGCLIMAYIDGLDLGDYLDIQPEQRIEVTEARILMLPVVSALVELHANGIIHRDIKPDNVVRFVRADGRPGVKLVDFGIARRQVDQGMTASGYVLGTPPYLAPETMLGEKHTPLSDIYALGATLFEMITGDPPYGHGSVSEIMQQALHRDPVFPQFLRDTAMEALLKRMLAKAPSERPDAMEVLQSLEKMRDPLARKVRTSIAQRPTRELAPARAPSVQATAIPEAPASSPGKVPGSVPAIPKPQGASRVPVIVLAALAGALFGAALVALVLTH